MSGQTDVLMVPLCRICATPIDTDEQPGDGNLRTIHADCHQCPDCGSRMVVSNTRYRPALLRCLCCLHGWKRPGPPNADERPARELGAFVTGVAR